MRESAVQDIESQFAQLPPVVQISLLERLVHQVGDRLAPRQDDWEAGLSEMAADPEMQSELSRIRSDFSTAEADGLGRI